MQSLSNTDSSRRMLVFLDPLSPSSLSTSTCTLFCLFQQTTKLHRTTIASSTSLLAHNGQSFSSKLLLHTHIMLPSIQRIAPVVPVNSANRALQQSPQEPMHIREQLMLVHLHAHLLHLLLAGLLPKPRLEIGLHEIVLLLRVRMPFEPQNVRIGQIVVRHPLAEMVRDVRSHWDFPCVSTHRKRAERKTRSPRRSYRLRRCAECFRAANRDVQAPLRTPPPPPERTCCRSPAESSRIERF